jgi:hypothetical protein
MRTTLAGTVLLASGSLDLDSQPTTASPSPAFEVASIKIARNSGAMSIRPVPCTGERLTADGARVDVRFISAGRPA